jgi:hypothetical protein
MRRNTAFVAIGGRGRDAARFSFPILRKSEILICMEEWEFPVTEEELKEPSRHRDRLKQMWFLVVSDILL